MISQIRNERLQHPNTWFRVIGNRSEVKIILSFLILFLFILIQITLILFRSFLFLFLFRSFSTPTDGHKTSGKTSKVRVRRFLFFLRVLAGRTSNKIQINIKEAYSYSYSEASIYSMRVQNIKKKTRKPHKMHDDDWLILLD